MKFFILCFLILLSFSLMAKYNDINYENIPEEDLVHLSNYIKGGIKGADNTGYSGYGCLVINEKTNQCRNYCRKPRSGELNTVYCRVPLPAHRRYSLLFNDFLCQGVAQTAQKAEDEARVVCAYEAQRRQLPLEEVARTMNCGPPIICFHIVYP